MNTTNRHADPIEPRQMKVSVTPLLILLALGFSGCATNSGRGSFPTTRSFSNLLTGSAKVGEIYAITGLLISYDSHSIEIAETTMPRTATRLAMGENAFLLHCKDPIAEILDTQQRLHDVLFIFEGREIAESGKRGDYPRPRVSRRILGKGQIIGTRKWTHPDYQDEWNEWAGKKVQ